MASWLSWRKPRSLSLKKSASSLTSRSPRRWRSAQREVWPRLAAVQALQENRTEVVRARKGHGKRKGTPLSWATLEGIDPNMTRVAQRLATTYGYALELPTVASS